MKTKFAVLAAVALFTQITFASKPPPPPPSSGTVVLDYEYAGPNSATLFGLTVAPSGTIYSAGTGGDTNGDPHGIVLASSDRGITWWSILDDASLEWYTDFSGGISSDAFGNVYVAGMLQDVNAVESDRWIIRRSTDGGVTWTTVDSFRNGDCVGYSLVTHSHYNGRRRQCLCRRSLGCLWSKSLDRPKGRWRHFVFDSGSRTHCELWRATSGLRSSNRRYFRRGCDTGHD